MITHHKLQNSKFALSCWFIRQILKKGPLSVSFYVSIVFKNKKRNDNATFHIQVIML